MQNRDLLYEVKSEDPSTDPRKTEEQLAKAKVRSILENLREIITVSYIDTALIQIQLSYKQQGCHDSLNNYEPEIKFAIECGEQLVEDELTEAEEKEKIQEDVKELEKGFRDLKAESTKEKIRWRLGRQVGNCPIIKLFISQRKMTGDIHPNEKSVRFLRFLVILLIRWSWNLKIILS